MFGMLESIVKSAAAVVTVPVAVVADVVMLPVTATDLNKGPFDNTEGAVGDFMKNVKNIAKPGK